MNGNPTAAQKRFHEWARNSHWCIVGLGYVDSIHHIKGSKMKLKGVRKAGEWFILPLSYWWHQDGNNPAALHVNRKEFERVTGRTEKEHWTRLINIYSCDFGHKPMSEEEYQIILDRA